MQRYTTTKTPKQSTEWILASVLVRGEYIDQKADSIVFALMDTYAPDIMLNFHNISSFPNPTLTSRFPYVPLGKALRDVCRLCYVVAEVNDKGELVFRSETIEERLRRAMQADIVLHKVKQTT